MSRSGNFAQRRANEKMGEADKPQVGVVNHLGVPDENIILIDHLQFGDPITGDELKALHAELERAIENEQK